MKLVAVLFILFLIPFRTLSAEEFNGKPLLDKVVDSVFRVYAYTNNGSLSEAANGTGFVVKQSVEETIIATAGHVFGKNAKTDNTSIHFYYKGNRYTTNVFISYLFTQEIDAALVYFKPGIQGLKALDFNLENNYNIVNALAFGFPMGYSLGKDEQQLTFTYGKINRSVGMNIAVNQAMEQNNFVIRGTPVLIGGYSGGPVLDTDFKVLGINISISYRSSSFTDGRCLWNLLNPNSKVDIKIDNTFNALAEPNEYRISINPQKDGLVYNSKLITFETIIDLFTKAVANSFNEFAWVRSDVKVLLNGKIYDIYRIQSDVKDTLTKSFINQKAKKDSNAYYIYLSKNGFRFFVHLDVVKGD